MATFYIEYEARPVGATGIFSIVSGSVEAISPAEGLDKFRQERPEYEFRFPRQCVEQSEQEKPHTTTVKLLSVQMCSAPSLLTWAIAGYRFKRDRAKLRKVFTDGYGLTDQCADDLLSGRVPFTDEDGHAVFQYEEGKAKRAE